MIRYLERVKKNSYNLNSLDLRLGRMLRLIVQTCRNVSLPQLRLQRLFKDGSSERYGEGGLGEFSSCTDLFVKIFHAGTFFGDISFTICFLFGNSSESQCRNLFF